MNSSLRTAWMMAGAVVMMTLAPRAEAQIGIAPGGTALNRPEPVKDAPYSAEAVTEISQTLPGGSRVIRTTTRIYRDSQGRERREETLDELTGRAADPQRAPTVSIFDPVEGASYILNVLEHSAVRMPLPGSSQIGGATMIQPTIQFTPMPGAAGAGAQTPHVVIQQGNHVEVTGPAGLSPGPAPLSPSAETLEPAIIEGLRAEGARTVEKIPAGRPGADPIEVVTETWTSPELKVQLMNRHSDPRGGEVTYRLTHISRSEPDHALFVVPSDYVIKATPSISGGMVTGGVSVGVRPGGIQPGGPQPGGPQPGVPQPRQ